MSKDDNTRYNPTSTKRNRTDIRTHLMLGPIETDSNRRTAINGMTKLKDLQ